MTDRKLYADCEDVMARTEQLVAAAAISVLGTTKITVKGTAVDLAPPWPRVTLGEAIRQQTGIDPLALGRDSAPLLARMQADGMDTSHDKTWAQLVDHMLSHYVEPTLIAPTFLTDYPVELSPLARRKPGADASSSASRRSAAAWRSPMASPS